MFLSHVHYRSLDLVWTKQISDFWCGSTPLQYFFPGNLAATDGNYDKRNFIISSGRPFSFPGCLSNISQAWRSYRHCHYYIKDSRCNITLYNLRTRVTAQDFASWDTSKRWTHSSWRVAWLREQLLLRNLPIERNGDQSEDTGCNRHVGDEVAYSTVETTKRPMTRENIVYYKTWPRYSHTGVSYLLSIKVKLKMQLNKDIVKSARLRFT